MDGSNRHPISADCGWRDPLCAAFVATAHGEKPKIDDKSKVIELEVEGETVVLTELMRSVAHDVVKIEAHTHIVGAAAEYKWKDIKYPGSKRVSQALVVFNVSSKSKPKQVREIVFDRLEIKLESGNSKELYFDISSFFGGGVSSLIDPDAFIARKISDLYSD